MPKKSSPPPIAVTVLHDDELCGALGPLVDTLLETACTMELRIVVLITPQDATSINIISNCHPDLGAAICRDSARRFPQIKDAIADAKVAAGEAEEGGRGNA